MVGVIPGTKRCARDAGFRFDQPLNYPQLAASRERPAIDGCFPLHYGPPGVRGLHNHLSKDKWGARSSGTKRPSSLARPSPRPARHTPMRAGPMAAATGLSERVRSAAIETSD